MLRYTHTGLWSMYQLIATEMRQPMEDGGQSGDLTPLLLSVLIPSS